MITSQNHCRSMTAMKRYSFPTKPANGGTPVSEPRKTTIITPAQGRR